MKPMSRIVSAVLLSLVVLACATEPAPAAEAAPQTEDEKVLYAVGLALAQQLASLGITAEELPMVQAGLAAATLGEEPAVDLQEYGPKIQGFAQQRLASAAETEKVAAAAFLEEQAAEAGAVTTDSGIVITEMTAGTGDGPAATDRVKVHYHGTLRDGKVFDSSVDRGTPATFGLNQVIACWTEALQTMKVGGKSRIVCPADLAYGEQGRPPTIPPGAALVFEVELLEIVTPDESS